MMKTQIYWNRLQKIGQIVVRQITPSAGAIIVVALMLLFVDFADAAPWRTVTQVPVGDTEFTVPYQGRLTDASGTPINNTSGLEMAFSLYTQEVGGSPIWSEPHTGVPVSDGLFNVYLGSITSLDPSLFDDALWLGVKIENDPEMTPRERIIPNTGGVQSAGVPVGTVISWWRADASTSLPSGDWEIADGSTVTDPDSPLYGQSLPDLTNKFVMGTSADDIGQIGGTNTLNLSHQHQVDNHSHSLPSHNHSYSGTTSGGCCAYDGGYYYSGDDSVRYAALVYASSGAWYYRHKHTYSGSTSSWSGTSGTSQPNTNYQLSSTVNNRPEYVGLIFLIRIK